MSPSLTWLSSFYYRYINQVIVSDMAGNRKWHFLCNCWLAEDLGDCERDRVFTPVSKKQLFSFRYCWEIMVFYRSLKLCSFFFILHSSFSSFFLFFRLYNLNWPILHLLILSSTHSIMLWTSLPNFSFHSSVFFNCTLAAQFFLKNNLSLLIFLFGKISFSFTFI